MLTHKFIFILLLTFLYTGCSRTFAPSGWLPETDDYPQNVYGGWLTLVVSANSSENKGDFYEYKGEFLSSDQTNVYLLADSTYIVKKTNIKSAVLELTQKNTGTYVGWGLAFLLTPAINGVYSIFTAPAGIIAGVTTAAGESARDRYESESPNELYWSTIQKFARFPQGLPEGIEIMTIKPKSI